MWRTVCRGTDEIEEICDKAEENLHVSNDDTYWEIDLYDETTAWVHYKDHQKCWMHMVQKESWWIYMEKFSVMTYLTENAMELMEQLFELKLQSKSMLNKF